MCATVRWKTVIAATLVPAGLQRMSEIRLAIILIVLGMLALANGGFHYLREANAASFVPVSAAFEDSRYPSVSLWLGIGAIFAGVVLLLTRTRHVDLNR